MRSKEKTQPKYLALTTITIVSASSSLALSTTLISFSTLFKRKDNAATLILVLYLSYFILSLKKTYSTSKKIFNKKNLK
ncbi:hypothetical protein HBI94_229640 [Parastagonospora nodorum]|nr:hypothetical protein HBI94_229640 [Parastagonospora nodorum]